MNVLNVLDGWKSYISACGLAGLAIYELSKGDLANGYTHLMAALAVFGLRHAIAKG